MNKQSSRSERAELVERLRMWGKRNHVAQFGKGATLLGGTTQEAPPVEESDYWKAADCIEKMERELAAVRLELGSSDSYKEAVAANLKLRKALEQCVRVAQAWHGDDAFDIYFNHSPEMKLIRDALGKMPDPTDESNERPDSTKATK